MPDVTRKGPTAIGFQQPLPPGWSFGLRFTGYLIVCSFLFWRFDVHLNLETVQRALATSAAWLDNVIGGSSRAVGIDIDLDGIALTVNHECTGIFIAILLVSFVLAYPASVRSRSLAITIGLPLLLAVNALRLALLARILTAYPAAFFYFHEYVWQGIFMVLVLVGCLFWAEHAESI